MFSSLAGTQRIAGYQDGGAAAARAGGPATQIAMAAAETISARTARDRTTERWRRSRGACVPCVRASLGQVGRR